MYDRASRNLTGVAGSTTEHVGPGAYDSDLPNQSKIRADGYAPFLSMTGRESCLNPSDSVIAAPGPGQYDPAYPQDVVLGGRTMSNKSRRFQDPSKEKDTPGPGAYTLSKKSDWIKETGRQAGSVPDTAAEKGGMLLTSRIKFHRKPAAPSIPTPGQAYGYEENDDGTLRKQEVPDRDGSMGPAFYNPNHTETKATKNYRGIHFGKLTSKRMDFSGREGPGPGEYEAFQTGQAKENVNMQEEDHMQFEARLPRYHELVAAQEEKKAVPGPGKYEVKGMFDPKPAKVNTEGIEVEHPPFMSQAKRFGPTRSVVPAPGTYNDPRGALDSLKKITGLKRSPFGQTSVRFQPEPHIKKTPGPGSYNSAGMGSDSMRKAYIESTRRGAFGTTAVRVQPITKREMTEVPGPAHYQVQDKPFQSRYQQLSSTFASLSTRLTEIPSIIKDIPPPGSYQVDSSYKKSQGKHAPGAPRTTDGRRKHGAFQSSSSRFAPPRDVIMEETDPQNPGPGTYVPQGTRGQAGGLMVTKDKRFKEVKSDMPGPGTYEFSPLIQDTVLKGTFNATLNNPVAPRMDTFTGQSAANQAFLLGV